MTDTRSVSFDVYRDVLVTWGGAVFSGFSEVAKPYVEAYNAELERTGKSVLTQTEKVSLFVAEQQRTMRLLESNARAYAAAAAEAGEKGIAAIMTKWSNYFSAKAAQVPIGIAERQAWLADLVADANSRIAHVDQVIGRFGFKPGKLAGPIIDGAQMISGAHKYYETGDSTEWENACAGVSLSWLLAAEAPIVVTAIAGTTLAAPYLLAAAAVGAAVGSFVGGKYFQDFKEALLSSDWFIAGVDAIAEATTTHFRAAFTLPKCDPLAIDLDGDGIETVGIGGSPVLFDHDGDGLRSGTGWLAGDDGWLVRDLNGNGQIDSGRELFGADTQIIVGGVARNASSGFEALAALDTNADDVFDAADAAFGQLRIWRDLNQDGLSQGGELSTLAANGITGIELTPTGGSADLGNGNSVSGRATVHRAGGVDGEIEAVALADAQAANLDLADNPFYREFTTAVPLTEAAQALPDMRGSGWVRDLREAMSLGNAQAEQVQQAAAVVQLFRGTAMADGRCLQ